MLKLSVLPQVLAICLMGKKEEIPPWVTQASFYTVSKTADELSVVCDQNVVPPGITKVMNWRAFTVKGPLDFSMTGVVASLSQPLAQAEIPIFVISTYRTDYLLVQEDHFDRAKKVLQEHFIVN